MSNGYTNCEPCGKRLYSSKQRARAATAKTKNRIRVYVCPKGGGFHVTDRQKGKH